MIMLMMIDDHFGLCVESELTLVQIKLYIMNFHVSFSLIAGQVTNWKSAQATAKTRDRTVILGLWCLLRIRRVKRKIS